MCNFRKDNSQGNRAVKKEIFNTNSSNDEFDTQEVKIDLNNQSDYSEVYLQTLIVRVKGNNKDYFLRTIIDTGSQSSYISKHAAKVLKLKSFKEITLNHGLFSGIEVPELHKCYRLKISSTNERYTREITVLDQKKICPVIPRISNKNWIRYLRNKGIYVSDVFEKEHSRIFEQDSREIHLLLGADVAGSLFTGKIEYLPWKGLVALRTKLGWTVMGKTQLSNPNERNSVSALSLSLQVSNCKISDLWRLDILGILDEENKNKDVLENEIMHHFSETVKQDVNGRFEVSLPWILDKKILPSNFNLARNCLDRINKKLINARNREEYSNVFREWESNGIIESVTIKDTESEEHVHYLPHHPVIKESSETTKIRPVFNASAKIKNSPSLNDCLAKGPNLLEIIPSVLNRFRKYRIGISADIEKAFLMISVREQDRDYLRFIWLDEENNLKIFRHNRIVFGLVSSPFLLSATLNHLFNQANEKFKETVELLRNSFYVDNCLMSLNSVEETRKFVEESKDILYSGKFNLRCWQSNYQNVLFQESTEQIVAVLGMKWNLEEDTLSCKIDESSVVTDPITKRKILAQTQKIFDPIGFTAPITIVPKIILQETWLLKLRWDEEIPETLSKQFKTWVGQLPLIERAQIPRWLNIDSKNERDVQLHVFSDASKRSYATCAFLRTEDEFGAKIKFVNARSRVAPLKALTIPRLELLSCLIGARLASSICNDLKLSKTDMHFWSDSTTALAWIGCQDQWGTFVHNRVREIRELTDPSSWKYVPGKLNPADLPSRGCNVKEFLKTRWWEGPDWLKLNPEEWPITETTPDIEVVNSERKKTIISATNSEIRKFEFFEKISSFSKIIRITAYIIRFCENVTKIERERNKGRLKMHELQKAEKLILKKIQEECFTEDGKLNVRTVKDPDGLLRVETRISSRKDLETFRFPILLPNNHQLVEKLIRERHEELNHAGTQTVMGILREHYWIIRCRKTVQRILRKCIVCRRFTARPVEVLSPPLPEDRVREAQIFEVIGVDLCGPLYLKDGDKSWVVLFTCAVFRAIHVELVNSLSTENFLLAFRRFIARRGRPTTVISDNGSNLTRASAELRSINFEKVTEFANYKKINWKFNPPSAPWWGGFFERLIGMLKAILRKVLRQACLRYEEMYTVLCDVESIINSRPLTYVSEDQDDLTPLTPAMFLQEIKETGVPDIDLIDADKMKRRFAYRQRIREDLRKRFRVEYLGQLKDFTRRKKETHLNKGDVVLIGDDNSKRIDWPLGKIEETFPGKDGKIRVARVRTKHGTYLRPVRRLYHLEVRDSSNLFLNDYVTLSS